MFKRNKNSYKIDAVCTDGISEGKYSFTEDYDSDWWTIAKEKFNDEFGSDPTEMHLESRERI